MTGRIVFVSSDVLFWASVQAQARARSRAIIRVDDEAAMEAAFRDGGVDRVIVDLGVRSVDALSWAPRWKSLPQPPELVAFGSHVDEASLDAARAAGFDRVMPNSRFHRALGELLA